MSDDDTKIYLISLDGQFYAGERITSVSDPHPCYLMWPSTEKVKITSALRLRVLPEGQGVARRTQELQDETEP